MTSPTEIGPEQAWTRLAELMVIDVRAPGEYAGGHLPGAHNIPLDHLTAALPALKSAAARRDLLLVCASGVRSATACATLAEHGITAASLTGGTTGWSRHGYDVQRVAGARATWSMERQVRFAAGALVLTGLAVGLLRPRARWLAAGVAGGLVFSAVTDTCGMARVLSLLPHNKPRSVDLDATLEALDD
ncbi:rhodanese-like domain-containing protein [Streptomyces sp. NPDC059063]|uniref:rhodanese-like domain-containing protein n=1 Tax=unclassified Streptomyces TaxID=2593676 RepID=UPI0036D126C7